MSLSTLAPAYNHVGANAFRESLNAGLEFLKGRLKFLIGDALDLARAQFFGATLKGGKCDGFTKRYDRIFEQLISEPNPLRLGQRENHLANCSQFHDFQPLPIPPDGQV